MFERISARCIFAKLKEFYEICAARDNLFGRHGTKKDSLFPICCWRISITFLLIQYFKRHLHLFDTF